MVASIQLGASFEGALNYGAGKTKKGKASELVVTHNLLSDDVIGMAQEMEAVCRGSSHIRKPVLHISVSFHPEESPPREIMLAATYAYLEVMEIAIDDHQVVVYEHHDTAHKHLHVYINRIRLSTFTAASDSFYHLRSESACRIVEKQLDLRPTESLDERRRNRKRKGNAEIIAEISSIKGRVKDHHYSTVRDFIREKINDILRQEDTTAERFTEKLGEDGVEVLWRKDEYDRQVGVSFRYDNRILTGVKVGFKAEVLLERLSK